MARVPAPVGAAPAAAVLVWLGATLAKARAAEQHWFDQIVEHGSTSNQTFRQRFYVNDAHFKGPGHPLFVILGGEGALEPEDEPSYPWVQDVLARRFGALVLEPEHRFYGASLPHGPEKSFTREGLKVMTTQQALTDCAHFIRAQQKAWRCGARGTAQYCPVLTIGGSYPGYLSAMMRLRFPAVVDMAYAASAPVRFYMQRVGERDRASLRDDLVFLAEQRFANLNMANYPPGPGTKLAKTCNDFLAAAGKAHEVGGEGTAPLLDAMRQLLMENAEAALKPKKLQEDHDGPTAGRCNNITGQLPAGPHATARCGDWSGCGQGRDGEMWDYQTCTFEVERIGFGGWSGRMFLEKPWSSEWLREHCQRRFGVQPQPTGLSELWGFDESGLEAQTSRIVFTNGLNDGWSAGSILSDVAPYKGIVALNMPNGAHHSDLSFAGAPGTETPDVREVRVRVLDLVASWLEEVRAGPAEVYTLRASAIALAGQDVAASSKPGQLLAAASAGVFAALAAPAIVARGARRLGSASNFASPLLGSPASAGDLA